MATNDTMATLTAADEALLQDPILQERIANLAKVGLLWTPPSQRPVVPEKEEPSPVYSDSSDDSIVVKKGPKHPRQKEADGPDVPSEPESESEMMGTAYQDKLRARAEAAELDKATFAELGLKMGEKSDKIEQFIPWRFLLRYGVSKSSPSW